MLVQALPGTFELECIGEQISHVAVLIRGEGFEMSQVISLGTAILEQCGAVAVIGQHGEDVNALSRAYQRMRDLLPVALTVYANGSLVL